jgi:sugar transferase (PEP-CTERM/EpsH1 system associated)
VAGFLDRFRGEYTDSPGILSSEADLDRIHSESEYVPLIAHVIYHLAVGGLENGLVNLINRLPRERFRHAIICLTDYTEFRSRIQNPDVRVYVLHKRPGNDARLYLKLWQLFRELKPDIVHTRNLATLEAQLPALIAGVPYRVHGEHGRDISDLDGTSRKYQIIRRLFSPLVQRYIALSLDLDRYLQVRVGIPASKISHISNGVDTEKFRPASQRREGIVPENFSRSETFIIGTVGRMEAVKDQLNLVNAFIRLVNDCPQGTKYLRLIMIGDGMLRKPALSLLEAAGLSDIAWLPGECDNVPELLGAMDVFVLPSLAEGISNTILEAMATALPVVATNVGGNSEILLDGTTGFLVPRSNPDAMAAAIRRYVDDPNLRRAHGACARSRCETEFSIGAMLRNYQNLYDELLPVNRKSSLVSHTGY